MPAGADDPDVALAPCRLQQQLELKQHSLALLRERIAGSESAQLADALAASEAEEAEARAAAEAERAKKAELAALAKVGRLALFSTPCQHPPLVP